MRAAGRQRTRSLRYGSLVLRSLCGDVFDAWSATLSEVPVIVFFGIRRHHVSLEDEVLKNALPQEILFSISGSVPLDSMNLRSKLAMPAVSARPLWAEAPKSSARRRRVEKVRPQGSGIPLRPIQLVQRSSNNAIY